MSNSLGRRRARGGLAAIVVAGRVGLVARGLGALALVGLTGCPAPQVGKLEGPAVLEEPTTGGPPAAAVADGGAAPTGPGTPTTPPAPRPDRDADGVADADDPCPDLGEIMNGHQDDDGCPDDPPRIFEPIVEPAPVPKIYFAAGKAALTPEAFAGLDAVAALMREHPDVRLVELQGHVDGKERGRRLDVARAEAVRVYLVARGIEPARLAVKGYGATRPLDPARTDAARARNRRVEMTVALRIDEP